MLGDEAGLARSTEDYMEISLSRAGKLPAPIESCIEACLHCHRVCIQMAMTHCLEMGGRHVEPTHFRLMINCAELCELAANFQLAGSGFSEELCTLCGDVCTACAQSCRTLDGMEACVQACEACAASCRSMMVGHHH